MWLYSTLNTAIWLSLTAFHAMYTALGYVHSYEAVSVFLMHSQKIAPMYLCFNLLDAVFKYIK